MFSVIKKKVNAHNDHAKESACFVLKEHLRNIPKEHLEKIQAIANGELKRFTFTPDVGIDEVKKTLEELTGPPLSKNTEQVCSYLCVHKGLYDNLYERNVNTYYFDKFYCFMEVNKAIKNTFRGGIKL